MLYSTPAVDGAVSPRHGSCPIRATRLFYAFASLLVLALGATAWSADWPQWRGPTRNGISAETNVLIRWPPTEKWRTTVGVGYSCVTISEGRLYTMGWSNNQESVYCFDAMTGTQIWVQAYACASVAHGYPQYEGSRSAPTVDGGRLYTFGHEGAFNCYNKTNGNPLWSTNFACSDAMTWRYSSSPLVEGNLIILNANGRSGLAIDKATHSTVWTCLSGSPGYSSAYAFDWSGQRVVAILSDTGLYGINPANGATNWSYAYANNNCADPVVYKDKIFISNNYSSGGRLLQLTNGTLPLVWNNANLEAHTATPILLGDYMYGFDGAAGGGVLTCVAITNGATIWSTNLTSGSLMAADGKLIVVSDTDKLAVLRATPTGPDREGRALYSLPAGEWWTMPVLADSMIYCRSREGMLVALDVYSNRPPAVQTTASATPNPVTWTSASLSTLGADDGGETNLIYTWAATAPPAPVAFAPNSNNTAKTTTATFTRAGGYNLNVSMRDAAGLTATSSVSVVVTQSVAAIQVRPASTNVSVGWTQAFSGSATDQFGFAFSPQPVYAWAVTTGGTIDASGLFSAGDWSGGPYAVRAVSGGKTGTASIVIVDDMDGDGVKDNWERLYGFDPRNAGDAAVDDDSDGMGNYAEFIAGTHPSNNLSLLALEVVCSNGVVVVTYPTIQASGIGYEGKSRYYSLETRTNLIGGTWDLVPAATNILGNNAPAVYSNAPAGEPIFYRVKVWLQ